MSAPLTAQCFSFFQSQKGDTMGLKRKEMKALYSMLWNEDSASPPSGSKPLLL